MLSLKQTQPQPAAASGFADGSVLHSEFLKNSLTAALFFKFQVFSTF